MINISDQQLQQQQQQYESIKQQLKNQNQEHLNSQIGNGNCFILNNHQQFYAFKKFAINDGLEQICEDKLQAAKNEGKILQKCNHPNIVRYYGEFQIGDYYYILIEKCEMSLKDWLDMNNHSTIDRQLLVSFALQILQGFQYLHENNLFLRNISLQSILIDTHKRIKFYDFGQPKQITSYNAMQSLFEGINRETFYCAPEFLELMSQGNSFRSMYQNIEGDIWSIGMCLCRMAGAKMGEHAFQTVELSHSYSQFQDSEISQIYKFILQKNPESRPSIQNIIAKIQCFDQSQAQIYHQSQEYLLNEAVKSFEIQDYCKTINKLNQLIENYPQNDEYQAWISKTYIANQELEKGQYWSEKSQLINPNNKMALVNLGNIQYRKQKYVKALEYYKKAIGIDINYFDALFSIAILYDDEEMYDECIILYKRCAEISPNDVSPILLLGGVYQKKGMLDQALILFQKSIRIDPQHEKAHFSLGNVYDDLQMYEEAISCYKMAVQIDPDNIDYLNNLGNSQYCVNKAEEAIQSYEECVKIDPSATQPLLNLASLYHHNQIYPISIHYYKRVLRIDKHNLLSFYHLGIIYNQLSIFQSAITHFNQCLLIHSNHNSNQKHKQKHNHNHNDIDNDNDNEEEILNEIGWIYFKKQMYNEAIQYFKKQLLKMRKSKLFLQSVGIIYLEIGKYKLAQKFFKKALLVDSENAETLSYLGNALYYDNKQQDEAVLIYQDVLDAQPNHNIAAINIRIANLKFLKNSKLIKN